MYFLLVFDGQEHIHCSSSIFSCIFRLIDSHGERKTTDDVQPMGEENTGCCGYQEDEEIFCGSRLPSGQAVICRIMYLCKKAGPGQRQMSAEEACKIVSKELCEIWIRMNVYPLHENSVTHKLRDCNGSYYF